MICARVSHSTGERTQTAAVSPISMSGILRCGGSQRSLDSKAYCKCSLHFLHAASRPVLVLWGLGSEIHKASSCPSGQTQMACAPLWGRVESCLGILP